MNRYLVHPFTSKHHVFFFYSPGITVAHTATVVTLDRWEDFAILQSQIYWIWVLEYGNKLETRPQYSPSTCFDTFPIPCRPAPGLKEIGITLYEFRDEVMRELGKGATAVYNLVDKKSEKSDLIKKLRELHIEMDNTVALAYGWGDLDLRHGFYETKQGFRFTISEEARRKILQRLLKLNHERYEEEVAQGLHPKKAAVEKKKTTRKKRKLAKVYEIPSYSERDIPKAAEPPSPQMDIFHEEEE